MAEVKISRQGGLGTVYAYDAATDAAEVNGTLHKLVKEFKMNANIWVISGTHGDVITGPNGERWGIVTPAFRQPDFKKEDLDTANQTSKQIHIKDYHLLAPNTWAELSQKPAPTNVLVLAWCFSAFWFTNPGPGGNAKLLSL